MAMVVQHNMMAMNSNRMLGVTTNGQAKSSEKLSSGYKINRAADDAAGLTISEKMRSQVRGLNRASTNAQDGVSLIQTAEGALNEAHSILQRMNELAVQGANDTNQTIDRDAINEELASLTEEINRISQTTQFNKQELLNGTFSGKKLQVGANYNQNISITIKSMNATAIGLTGNKIKVGGSAATGTSVTSAAVQAASNDALSLFTTAGTSGVVNSTGLTRTSLFTASGVTPAVASTTTSFVRMSTKTSVADVSSTITLSGPMANTAYSTYFGAGIAGSISGGSAYGGAALTYTISGVSAAAPLSVTSTVPVTASASAAGPGTAVRVDNYSIANETLCQIQNAINNVSKQRSALGALQNRLEHTISNLDNVAENTQAAESRIRDTDMASEMVEYSKNNILAQAGQSMLAQSNQSTQGVLSLLQ